MNITKIKLTVVGICGLMLVPFASHASTATLLNDHTALFTIDFSFTDDLFEVQVPIAAEFRVEHNDRVDTVGYTLETTDFDMPYIEQISAVVLSTANIEDNKYLLNKGETGVFTLFILATFTDEITTEQSAVITKIPYWIDDRRTSMHQSKLDQINIQK